MRKRWQPACDNQKTGRRFAGLCGSINYCACLKVLDLRLLTLLLQQTPPVSGANKRAFMHAVHLVRLIVHDLEATLKAETGENAGPPPGLSQDRLAISEVRAQETPGTHTQQIVRRMLDFIHENYSRPMQLSDLAAALEMNAAYLCCLFSTTVGKTFHHYLEDLRLAKARDLLRDPLKRVCEVACAVGYTNPNHFRDIFRSRVGISPSAWRQASKTTRCG